MTRWLLFFCSALLFLLAASAKAQLNPLQGHGAPTGVCTVPYVDVDSGNFYTCKTGLFTLAGGSGGACTGANCFLLQNFTGYFGDTQEILTATWTGGTTTVTAPSGTFKTADTGKLCWGSPQLTQTGPATAGTFTFISSSSGTCAPSSALIGGPSGNGMFTWGHDDTAAFTAVTAALYNQPKCGSLILPAARMMLGQGVSFTGSVASDCNINITGSGYSSVIELLPQFSFSAVTNSIGCIANGCFWSNNVSTAYLYFTISGEYNSLNGISTLPASSLFTIPPGGYSIGVNLFNWATQTSNGPNAINITGYAAFGLGTAATNWGNGNILCNSNYCIGENDGGTNVTLKELGGGAANAGIYDYSGTYNGVYNAGGIMHLFGTTSVTGGGGAFGSASCDKPATTFAEGVFFGTGTPGAGDVGFMFNNSGSGNQCILRAHNSIFQGSSSGAAIKTQNAATPGQFVDEGGNTFIGPVQFTGTYTNLTALNVTGTCTGTVTASSTLGLYGTGPNVTLTTCTSTTLGSGIVMNKNATIYELLVTAGTGGVNASSGAVTVLKNGVAQTMTCTLGTGTSCQDGATAHQISVTNGDRISLQFTTQAADTLAGVNASLIID